MFPAHADDGKRILPRKMERQTINQYAYVCVLRIPSSYRVVSTILTRHLATSRNLFYIRSRDRILPHRSTDSSRCGGSTLYTECAFQPSAAWYNATYLMELALCWSLNYIDREAPLILPTYDCKNSCRNTLWKHNRKPSMHSTNTAVNRQPLHSPLFFCFTAIAKYENCQLDT